MEAWMRLLRATRYPRNYAGNMVFLNKRAASGVTLPSSGGDFELVKSGQDIVLRDHVRNELFRENQQSLTQMVVHGSASGGTLTVDLANGNPLITGGITFDGAGGDNRLVLTGGSATVDTLDFTNASDGQVSLDGLAIKYSGLKSIDDQLSAANRVFKFSDSNDNVTLADNGTTSDGMSRLSLLGGVTVDFASPSDSLVLRAGAGDDTVTLSGADTLMTRTVGVFGDDSNDVLTGSSQADYLDGGAGNDQLFGRSGDDTLVGGDGLDTLLGGAGQDSLDGGSGNDRLNGQGRADTISGGLGDDYLIGGEGIDLLAESGDVNFLLKQTTLTGLGVDH
jgi:Ca2+-binding RTX toxin-like protein